MTPAEWLTRANKEGFGQVWFSVTCCGMKMHIDGCKNCGTKVEPMDLIKAHGLETVVSRNMFQIDNPKDGEGVMA